MTSRVSELRRILAFIGLFTVGAAAVAAAALRGHVVDAHGQRVDGARVQAWHIVATDQRPPQRPTLLAKLQPMLTETFLFPSVLIRST
jgi:hypothetical protein